MTAQRGRDGIEAIRDLKHGWSSDNNSQPIGPLAILTAVHLINTPPFVVPVPNGGIQLAWHEGGVYCTISIRPDGSIEGELRWKD